MCLHGYSDKSSLSCEADQEHEHKFGKCFLCGKFHSHNSCVIRNVKCFECGKTERIQVVCISIIHFSAGNAKVCKSNPIKLDVSNEPHSDQIHDIVLPNMYCSHDPCIPI